MRIDFSKIKMLDLDNKEVKDHNIHKTIANILYLNAKTLDLVETAREINKGATVELDKSEIQEIRQLISDTKNGVYAFARQAIFEYLDKICK